MLERRFLGKLPVGFDSKDDATWIAVRQPDRLRQLCDSVARNSNLSDYCEFNSGSGMHCT